MCYSATSLVRKQLEYALHRGNSDRIAELERKLLELSSELRTHYYADAFAHPRLLVFTNTDPYEPQAFHWGLIPSWSKTKADAFKIWNQTVNARGETIFGKPAFRNSAKSKRCLIYLDSFFEYHHAGGRTFPFCISMKADEPMALGGLWEEWVDRETGEIYKTCAIVTTTANDLMARIHNNPKLQEPRMPVILPKKMQNEWLRPINNESDKKAFAELIRPYDEAELNVYTVAPLKGKNGSGDSPQALEKVEYEELVGF